MILIKLTTKDKIFYNQLRTGKNGKNFKMYKFRTMNNKKVTKIGKILRNASLDELPQFLNVLKGEMSIIGPRPWIPEYYKRFNKQQKRRTEILPGIIGLAQVNGRNNIDIFKKINYDIEYINNLSLKLDIKILLKSFKSIIIKEDINKIEEHLNNELKQLENQ
jgi:lipopolysaccharide/colanic/teichoic acid biosynthesis glycosyltransferase